MSRRGFSDTDAHAQLAAINPELATAQRFSALAVARTSAPTRSAYDVVASKLREAGAITDLSFDADPVAYGATETAPPALHMQPLSDIERERMPPDSAMRYDLQYGAALAAHTEAMEFYNTKRRLAALGQTVIASMREDAERGRERAAIGARSSHSFDLYDHPAEFDARVSEGGPRRTQAHEAHELVPHSSLAALYDVVASAKKHAAYADACAQLDALNVMQTHARAGEDAAEYVATTTQFVAAPSNAHDLSTLVVGSKYFSADDSRMYGTEALKATLKTIGARVADSAMPLNERQMAGLVAVQRTWGADAGAAFVAFPTLDTKECLPRPGPRNLGFVVNPRVTMLNDGATVPLARVVAWRPFVCTGVHTREREVVAGIERYMKDGLPSVVSPADLAGVAVQLGRLRGGGADETEYGVVVRVDESPATTAFREAVQEATGADKRMYWNPASRALCAPAARGAVPITVKEFLEDETGYQALLTANAATATRVLDALRDSPLAMNLPASAQITTFRDYGRCMEYNKSEVAVLGVGTTFLCDAQRGALLGISPTDGYALLKPSPRPNAHCNLLPAAAGHREAAARSLASTLRAMDDVDARNALLRSASGNKATFVPLAGMAPYAHAGALARYSAPAGTFFGLSDVLPEASYTAFGLTSGEKVQRIIPVRTFLYRAA